MKRRLVYFLAGFAVVMFFLSAMCPEALFAQSGLVWSPAQRIRGYAKDSDPPILVADQNRTVHAFNSQWTGGDLAIFYSQWSSSRGWTTPIDILLSPNARQAKVQGAFLDPKGFLHVIFYGGIEQGAEIYYSKVPVAYAAQARAWSTPKMIGPYATKVSSAALVGDDNGHLFVLYSGGRDGNGLYAIKSMDGGDTWSDLTSVFLTDDANQWVYNIKLNLDLRGRLHAVWDVYNRAGISETNYYARLDPDYKQWTLPITLDVLRPGDYEVNETSITSYKDELFIIYTYGSVPRHLMIRSQDGGKTWSKSIVIFPALVGDNGPAVFLVDGKNVLHVVLANRTADNRLSGLWHSEWTGDAWTDAEPIVTGPYGSPTFAPGNPHGIISQGNSVLVTWRTDPGLTPNGVWYSYATLSGPELPIVPLPTGAELPTFTPTASARVQPRPTSTITPAAIPNDDTPLTPVSDTSPALGIVYALLPVFLLLFVIVLRRTLR